MRIVLLEGDQTGQELLEQAVRVLQPEVLGLPVAFERFDLRLETRRATSNQVVREACVPATGEAAPSTSRDAGREEPTQLSGLRARRGEWWIVASARGWLPAPRRS
jgi:hypothetical protein